MKETIEKLKIDSEYYGDFGKQFMSNSYITNLMNDPKNYTESEQSVEMLLGNYFHKYLIEPDKLNDMVIVEASNRNTNIYKDAVKANDCELLLLKNEIVTVTALAEKMKSNMDIHEMIFADGTTYEEPMVKELYGIMWKCKRDIGNDKTRDLKTTSDLSKFRRSAYTYNYDSQAFINQEMFGKPFEFIVGCKKTGNVGVFQCSDEFIESGRNKVMDAVIQYNKFYGKNKTEDVDNFYFNSVL